MSIYSSPEFPPKLPQVPRRAGVGTVAAWIVILACVGLIATRVLRPGRADRDAKDSDPAKIPSPQLKLLGEYLVAAEARRGMAGATMPASRPVQATSIMLAGQLDQLEAMAQTPLDQLRTVPVVAEVLGREEALDRLDQLEKRYKVVRLRPDVDSLRAIYRDGPETLSPEQAGALVRRHGWFGKLALAWDKPANSPQRQEVVEPGKRLMTAWLIVLAAGLGAGLVGLVLLVLGIVLLASGTMLLRYRRPDPQVSSGIFAEGFAVFIFLFTASSLGIAWLAPRAGLGASLAMAIIVPIALVYMRLRGLAWSSILEGIGWRRGSGFFGELGCGAAGYLSGLPVILIGIIATAALMQAMKKTGQVSHPIINQPLETGWDLARLALLACVWAPAVEETVFRGMLFHHLRARLPWAGAAIINGVLFAAIHPQGWMAIPALTAIAVVLSGLREWRGSILAPMAAHALNNALALGLMWTLLR